MSSTKVLKSLPTSPKKESSASFLVSNEDLKKIKEKAAQYTNGNTSHWIRYASINHTPKTSELK